MTASLASEAVLFGSEGELVSLSIAVEPKLLEELLEALASLDFPINPQLYHRTDKVLVEFPAYSRQVQKVHDTLLHSGFGASGLEIGHPLALSHG